MHKSRLCLSVVILLPATCKQETPLLIVQAQTLDGTDCTVPSAPTAKQRTSGTLDVDLPSTSPLAYRLPLAVANNLSPTSGSTTFDRNDVTLTHFNVVISAPRVPWSAACPATFDTEAFTYRLSPQTTAGFSLDALSPAHSRCLLPEAKMGELVVTATIRAKGVHGDTDVTSAPFAFPIKVCAGCLQRGYDDPAFIPYEYPAGIPYCTALPGPNPYPGDPCFPGQDDLILCCGVATTMGGTPQYQFECPGVFTGTPVPDASAPVDL
jgi:hypothetical protein